MKSILIHGDNETASRNCYQEIIGQLKNKNYELVDVTKTTNYSPHQSLFSEMVAYQMEIDSPLSLKLFAQYAQEGLIIGWADKTLTPTQLKNLDRSKIEVELFKLNQNIWKFLDGLYPHNPNLNTSWQTIQKEESLEMIWGMTLWKIGKLVLSKPNDGFLKKIMTQALTLDFQVKTGILNTGTALTRLLLYFK
jgi:hypothetical protein